MSIILGKEILIQINQISDLIKESIDLESHPMNWLFEDDQANSPSKEHADQIFALNEQASLFLSKYQDLVVLPASEKYFRDLTELEFGEGMSQEVKKWLYQRDLKFDNLVYLSFQPKVAFVMTWKMAIHYSDSLFFGRDLVVWDKTLNWVLYYNHNDFFQFAKNRIFNGEEEKMQRDKVIRDLKEKFFLKSS